jgi:hypothetical protein
MVILRGKFSLESLGAIFKKAETYESKKKPGEFLTVRYTVEISYRNQPLFKYVYPTLRVLTPEAMMLDVTELLDRSAVFPLQLEFMSPNPLDNTQLDLIQTKYGIENWFRMLSKQLRYTPVLIPDTNFLRRHYYTNHFGPDLANLKESHPRFSLSRLTIIEIENKYNRGKKEVKSRSARLAKQSNDNREEKNSSQEKIEEEIRRNEKEIRIALQSIKEILTMKREGADVLPLLDQNTITSFTEKAGDDFADAWIRMEISKPIKSSLRGGHFQDENRVFVTCDLMNALAALAEGINTIFVSRIEEDKPEGYYISEPEHLALIIFNTAVQFGKCDCVITAADVTRRIKIIGMWNGKTINDWLSDKVMVEYPTSKFFD